MVSELHENDAFGALGLGKVGDREERRLGEALDGDVSQPYKERGRRLVKDAGEAPAGL